MTTTATTPVSELGMTVPGSVIPGMLSAPRNVMELMGNPDSSTMINFMRFARKSMLTKSKTEVSERLGGIHKARQLLLDTLAKIGPSRKDEIDMHLAREAAAAITEAGFGKYEAKLEYANRDDNKKVYTFTVTVIKSGTKDGAYQSVLLTTTTSITFDADTKKFLKQIAGLDKDIEAVETELLAVKSDFAKLDEWVEEKKAMIAVQQIAGLSDGRAQLEKFLGKAVVAEMIGAAV